VGNAFCPPFADKRGGFTVMLCVKLIEGVALITEEINNAIKTLSLSEAEFHQLPNEKAEPLYYELLNTFVEGGNRRWWWESFSKPSKSVQFTNDKGFERISEIVPDKKEKVWFVAEEDQLPFYPIYEATPEIIQKIIGECYGFEYYIIPKSKEWLLCENHHNYLIGIGKAVIYRIISA
jgi:hypothetical protein